MQEQISIYTNTTTLPLHNGHKVILGKSYNETKKKSLIDLIDADIKKFQNTLRIKRKLSFGYKLDIKNSDNGKSIITVEVTRFRGIKGRRYPMFQTRYIQRWRDENKPVKFFTNEFLLRNIDRAFSDELMKLRLVLKKIVNRYNFLKINKEGQEYAHRLKVVFKLGDNLLKREISKCPIPSCRESA